MNLITAAFGDLVTGAIQGVASKFIQDIRPNQGSCFLDVFNKNYANKLSVEDLDLSKEEENHLAELRNLSLNKGLDHIEVDINGKKFRLETKDFSFVPLV